MSTISVGTTLTTGLVLESDNTGNLVIKTGASGITAATFNSGGTAVIGALSVTSFTLSGGALPATQGGTGLTSTPTNGQLLIGDGTGYTLATLTAGSGMTVTNGTGTITLAAAGLPPVTVSDTTTISAVAGNHYVLTAASATTVILPASPTISDTVWITAANGLITNVVARNGKKINEVAEDMTIDSAYAGIQLRFSNDTKGWIFS
jgi:hypothetical protein